MTAEQVQALIDASLTRSSEQAATRLNESQKRLETLLARNLDESNRKLDVAIRAVSQASQDELRVFVAGLQSENLKSVQQFMQLSTAEQNRYVEGLLVDFSKYVQEQRNQDLQFFQTRVNSLEKNTDQFKQETEQLLSGIISTTRKNGVTAY
jgi:ribosomal protein S2